MTASQTSQVSRVLADTPSSPCPSRRRPVDLVHLARQTMGDRALETEVLGLMLRQIESLRAAFPSAGMDRRVQIAHAMSGAARNLGAFPLALAASRLESEPENQVCREAFLAELDHAHDFIRDLTMRDERAYPG